MKNTTEEKRLSPPEEPLTLLRRFVKLDLDPQEVRSGHALHLQAIDIHVNDGAFDASPFGGEGQQVALQ